MSYAQGEGAGVSVLPSSRAGTDELSQTAPAITARMLVRAARGATAVQQAALDVYVDLYVPRRFADVAA